MRLTPCHSTASPSYLTSLLWLAELIVRATACIGSSPDNMAESLFFFCWSGKRLVLTWPSAVKLPLFSSSTMRSAMVFPVLSHMRACLSNVIRFSTCSRMRSEEHTSELQSLRHLVCRLLLEKKKTHKRKNHSQAPHGRIAALKAHTIRY